MTLDDTFQPPEEEGDHECPECGKIVNKEGQVCSDDCFRVSLL